jgi:PAS domain S-box-containing protein
VQKNEPETLRKRIKRLLAVERAIDLNMLMSVTNKQGIILSANERFCEISQYDESELVGKSHNIINSGHHPKSFFTDMWKSIAAGKAWRGEIKNKAKDGSYYWVDTVIVPIFDDSEDIIEFLSLRVLITGRKEAELALADAAFTISHKIRQPFVNMQALLTVLLLEEMPFEEMKNMAKLMQFELEKIDALTRRMALDMHNYKTGLNLKEDML